MGTRQDNGPSSGRVREARAITLGSSCSLWSENLDKLPVISPLGAYRPSESCDWSKLEYVLGVRLRARHDMSEPTNPLMTGRNLSRSYFSRKKLLIVPGIQLVFQDLFSLIYLVLSPNGPENQCHAKDSATDSKDAPIRHFDRFMISDDLINDSSSCCGQPDLFTKV